MLDELLDDSRIEIEGISGTSAGAINAVMVADGLARGGPEEARKRLADFWRAASRDGEMSTFNRAISERLFSLIPIAGGPMKAWFDTMASYLSPYDLNPLNINPLKDLIVRFVDFDAVKKSEMPLFIAATNVHTGRLRVFPREKIDADAVMASAALPLCVQGGRDRRRALLGRRLHRQSADLSVLPHHRPPRTCWWCRSTRCCGRRRRRHRRRSSTASTRSRSTPR